MSNATHFSQIGLFRLVRGLNPQRSAFGEQTPSVAASKGVSLRF